MRLQEENELLMENLVRSKLEMAETQSESCAPSLFLSSRLVSPNNLCTWFCCRVCTMPTSLGHLVLLLTAWVLHLLGDYVKTKRALIRAVEKQAEMSEKMDLLKAELELLDKGEVGQCQTQRWAA